MVRGILISVLLLLMVSNYFSAKFGAEVALAEFKKSHSVITVQRLDGEYLAEQQLRKKLQGEERKWTIAKTIQSKISKMLGD